jgi:hypothetical protein
LLIYATTPPHTGNPFDLVAADAVVPPVIELDGARTNVVGIATAFSSVPPFFTADAMHRNAMNCV